MGRADGLDQPIGDRAARLGELLLELGLEVDVAAFGERDVLGERFDDGRPHDVETVGEIHGPDERLGHVGEDVLVADELLELGRLVAGPEAAHEGGQPQSRGDLGAGGAADHVGAQPRKTAFGVLGKAPIQLGRDGETEHAVAEKLKALVRAATLRHPRRVREDLAQQPVVELLRQGQQTPSHLSDLPYGRGPTPDKSE